MSKLKYAAHAYAWTTSWSNETLDLIDRAKGLGFDKIEVPLMELDLVDPERIKQRLDAAGMGVCTSTACSEAYDATSEDEATRRRAVAYLKRCVHATAEMGGEVFSGVIYSAIGARIEGKPDERHWERAAKAVKETARYARDLGVTVGVEPVNRYETFLVNTCEQGLKLIDMIDEPNVAIHPDAYHMNIEESDFYGPTVKSAPRMCHFHLSESHRGTPGTGLVDWDGIYRGLAEGGYSGTVGLESFVEVSPAMAVATCIWRPLADSSDQLLRDGLKYLKGIEAKYYS